MRACTPADREVCVSIIAETFAANPSVNVVIGTGGNKAQKLRRLAQYSFEKAIHRSGAFLSGNGKGVALVFRSDATGKFLPEQWHEIRFALALGPAQVLRALQREAYIRQHRYAGVHYYFWFLGVQKNGGRAVFELRDFIFHQAAAHHLPILLETSVWRNVQAYQRYGFEIYLAWKDEPNGITVWFMKKDFH